MTDALAARCARAVHVITPDGTVLAAGRACLCLLRVVGYARSAQLLSLPPFIWAVELGYWIVARNRHLFSRFFFRPDSRSA